MILTQLGMTQPYYTVSGYVFDLQNGEVLANCSVYLSDILIGTSSNEKGFYSLMLPEGEYQIETSRVGYLTRTQTVKLFNNVSIDFAMNLLPALKEVKIKGTKIAEELSNTEISNNKLSHNEIVSLPAFLGENDVIKAIQMLPGVSSLSEGASGLYVRGGGADQNLILIDDMPVYNINHLLGLFYILNPDIVKDINLFKGGFPARYGGRLSSVLDIHLKDGNSEKLRGSVAVGLIASKLNLEGPLKNENTTFNISFRRTYLDLLNLSKIEAFSETDILSNYSFYDFNLKLKHKFSDKNFLYFSSYKGSDKIGADYQTGLGLNGTNFSVSDDFLFGWKNTMASVRWMHQINSKSVVNTVGVYSKYFVDIQEDISPSSSSKLLQINHRSGIENIGIKLNVELNKYSRHEVRFGVKLNTLSFEPGVMLYETSSLLFSNDTTFNNSKIRTFEGYLYAEDNIDFFNRLKVNLGLGISSLLSENTFYSSVQPRISGMYRFSKRISVKAAYSSMCQYIHLLSSSSINLPTDLWLPSTQNIKPQNSHQFTLGGVRQFNHNFIFSIEGYYKKINGLLEYKDGVTLLGVSSDWEDKVEIGKGWGFGVEFLLEKKKGKTTGWIGYTRSVAKRQFKNLNSGKLFSDRHERPHDISIVLNHKFSDKIDVGATWLYGTGDAVTIPTQNAVAVKLPYTSYQRYSYYSFFNERNNYRTPAYHRLDIGVNFHKQKKHGERTWNLGIYNVYSRLNPFFLYFDSSQKGNDLGRTLYQISLFPIIPSVSYSYTF